MRKNIKNLFYTIKDKYLNVAQQNCLLTLSISHESNRWGILCTFFRPLVQFLHKNGILTKKSPTYYFGEYSTNFKILDGYQGKVLGDYICSTDFQKIDYNLVNWKGNIVHFWPFWCPTTQIGIMLRYVSSKFFNPDFGGVLCAEKKINHKWDFN